MICMIKEEVLNNMTKEELIQKIRELEEKNEILEIKINNYSNSYFSILHTLDNILQQTGYRRMTDMSKVSNNAYY